MNTGDEALMLTLVETVNEADRAAIEQGLLRFNSERTPAFAEVRAPENRPSPLDVIVRDAEGTLLGGLVAVTHWGWLDIGLLWLEERVRGQGYGTQVMRLAETEARRRGCHASRLTTYSFQAKGFMSSWAIGSLGSMMITLQGRFTMPSEKIFEAQNTRRKGLTYETDTAFGV